MEWILATRNAHKVEELQALLGSSVTLRSLDGFDLPELPETGRTLEANSEQKARFVFEKTGLPCLADDSGLEVEALDWAPGVDSAHYSGSRDDEANRQWLLLQLNENEHRAARFTCVLTLVDADGMIHSFTGHCHGTISRHEWGHGGFGYDKLFVPDGHLNTFAQMEPAEKNVLSHRAAAARKLRAWLELN